MITDKLLAACGGEEVTAIESVFSTYTYTGNGSTQTITTNVDADLVWLKGRSGATSNQLFDTVRGATYELASDTTAASTEDTDTLTSFSSTGFGLGADANVNTNTATYVSWSFAVADNFFYQEQAVKAAGVDKTVDLSSLGTIGMVAVKRTDSTGSWYVWHRSLTAGKLLYLEQTAAEATLGHITVSGTTVTLVDAVIADGTYVVYAWAHDTGADGLIQCGSFTTDSSGIATFANLGWEPQWLLIKQKNAELSWYIIDSARGLVAAPTDQAIFLRPNSSAVEGDLGQGIWPTATGFQSDTWTADSEWTYCAIRRGPMKLPTVGTQVYNAIARTGTGAAATVTGVGFAPDLHIVGRRTATGTGSRFEDRLRGATQELDSGSTGAEAAVAQSVISFNMDGTSLGTDADWNADAADAFINWFFRRYPGVFDEVCDTGTGSAHTISHNLTVAPELMIRKKRSATDLWAVYAGDATDYLILNTTAATADLDTIWNDTAPTASVFTVGTHDDVNGNTATFVTYLFATLPGISKVFSYTGNGGTVDEAGTSQTINCGFSTGARFVLLKCTSNTSDWVVVDTVRGLIAGNDPALSLNSTAAEVTTTDLLDPDNSGFVVNQLATGTTSKNFNVTGYTYVGFAIS